MIWKVDEYLGGLLETQVRVFVKTSPAFRKTCDSSQSDAHECETSVRRSAKMRKELNVKCTSKSDAQCHDKTARKSHERQPRSA